MPRQQRVVDPAGDGRHAVRLFGDYAARILRQVSLVATVGAEGVAIIENVYPDPATALS